MASTALSVLSLLPFVAGYSFSLTSSPLQCGQLSLRIIDGSGTPPYTALVVPFGASVGPTEQRQVLQQHFTDVDVSFPLPYPASSGFVVMVSDSTGVGTGGTSVPITVGSTSNTSCLSPAPSLLYSFQIIPNNAINQCQPTTLAWNSSAQGDVNFLLLIPGGQSSSINVVNPAPAPGGVTGFSWTPNLRAGATIVLVAGDSRGPGTGGSINAAVGNSPTQNSSCIDNSSPSSTAGTPAGAIQTLPAGSGVGNGGSTHGGSSGSHTGAIAGGVVGSLAALAIVGLVALFFIRQRRRRQHPVTHGVDLLPDGAQRDPEQPPEFYQPEPFIVPPSHTHTETEDDRAASASRLTMSDRGRRYSALSTTDQSESVYATTTGASGNILAMGGGRSTSYGVGSSRKSPSGLPILRPVNFVQHEDAGELPEASGSGPEPETVELPPSYTSVRR